MTLSAAAPTVERQSDVPIAPTLIGGKWLRITTDRFGSVHNPSTGEVIARVPMSGPKEVDQAVVAAKKAFATWGNTPSPKRASIMFAFRELLSSHFDELCMLLTRENGKTLEESKGDLRRGIEVVEFACGIPHLLKGESLPQVADQIDAVTTREALGVCAGITPFNFPAMVPLWMFPISIACGNTFILKPSEKVPLTAIRMAELLTEAGLPDGVFNVIHGGREVVDALCTHPGIASVSFVGSTRIAQHVYTTASATGKRVQAAGGAKNVLLVMPDAEPDATLRAIMGSSFGCAGQRCMAGSVLMGVGENADDLRDRIAGAIDVLKVDDTTANPKAEMGAVIDGDSRDRIRKLIDTATPEGGTLVRDGRKMQGNGFFVGPTLVDHVQPTMAVFKEEIFGPVLSMLRPKTLDEALATMNRVQFGNGASIFTSSGAAARQFTREIQCGMLGINVGVPAPMALFSFSGWNQSFFGDLHVQGIEGVMFYTRQKCVLSRWDSNYVRQHGW
jgi:malonate-semialdehyde dehydrogenase (acetylating)/methylmalonate-semialdehyde dehydrogenase